VKSLLAQRPLALLGLLLAAIVSLHFLHLISAHVAAGASIASVLAVAIVGVKTNWLDKTISLRLLQLGGPVVLAMLSQMAVNVVDTAFVGRLPSQVALPGVAAIGLSLPVFWLVGGFLSAISIGTQAITARRHGENADEIAGETMMTAVVLALVLGVGFSVLGYFALPHVLPFFNSNPQVLEQGLDFARIRYIGISSMVITAAFKAFFDGTSRTHVHMVAAIIMNILNLVLCYGLVFGELGLPRMEVKGAAWAATMASAIGTLVMLAWSLRPAILARYRLYRGRSFSWKTARSIIELSLPSGAATVIGMLGFLMFHKAVAAVDARDPSGLPINAGATGVIQLIAMLIFQVSFGFGTATAALVSQSMGAQDTHTAERYAWQSVKLGTLIMTVVGTLIFLYPQVALEMFIKGDELGAAGKALAISAGTLPLRILAIASILIAAAVVLTQSLYGAGNTRFVMIVEGILHLSCLVPLSWLLGVVLGGGLAGIWAAAAIYIVLLASLMGWKFAQGSWRTIRL
jgi:putative MATE family efflux protein